MEALCVLIKLNATCKILICGVYIPPQVHTRIYSLFIESLTNTIFVFHNYDHGLIAGDFILPDFNWIHPDLSIAPQYSNVFLDLASHLGIPQINDVVKDRGVQLYLIFGSPEIFFVSLAHEHLLANEPCRP